MVFSDEALVRAAAAAKTPIVSAIGHENDRPVLDDVADLRASTPTDAAKRVVPDVVEEKHKLEQLRQRLFLRVDTFVANQVAMIEQIRTRPILANPYTFIEVHESDISRLVDQMRVRLDHALSREDMQISYLKQQVRSLSPQSTLDRGYSVVRDAAGHVISDAGSVKPGQKLRVRLAKGELGAVAE
jgi:exodeoxyribonuclease VII large subunit